MKDCLSDGSIVNLFARLRPSSNRICACGHFEGDGNFSRPLRAANTRAHSHSLDPKNTRSLYSSAPSFHDLLPILLSFSPTSSARAAQQIVMHHEFAPFRTASDTDTFRRKWWEIINMNTYPVFMQSSPRSHVYPFFKK